MPWKRNWKSSTRSSIKEKSTKFATILRKQIWSQLALLWERSMYLINQNANTAKTKYLPLSFYQGMKLKATQSNGIRIMMHIWSEEAMTASFLFGMRTIKKTQVARRSSLFAIFNFMRKRLRMWVGCPSTNQSFRAAMMKVGSSFGIPETASQAQFINWKATKEQLTPCNFHLWGNTCSQVEVKTRPSKCGTLEISPKTYLDANHQI